MELVHGINFVSFGAARAQDDVHVTQFWKTINTSMPVHPMITKIKMMMTMQRAQTCDKDNHDEDDNVTGLVMIIDPVTGIIMIPVIGLVQSGLAQSCDSPIISSDSDSVLLLVRQATFSDFERFCQ